MKLFLIHLFVFGILKCSLSQKLSYSEVTAARTIRLSPEHTMGGTVSSHVSELTYSTLGINSKDDIVGYISQVCIDAGRFAIISKKPSGNTVKEVIHLYNMDGEIKNRILLTDLITTKLDFVNDISMSNTGFTISTTHSIIELDSTGNLKDRFKRSPNSLDDSISIGGATWYYNSIRNADQLSLKTALMLGDKVIISYDKTILPKYHIDLAAGISPYFRKGKLAYCAYPYNYEIFEISQNRLSYVYNFVFPMEYTLDTATFNGIKDDKVLKAFVNANSNAIIGFNHVLRYNDYIIFDLKYLNGNEQWLAYNLRTNEVIDLNSILPDRSNDFKPLLGWQNILRTDGEYLYSILYPSEILTATNNAKKYQNEISRETDALIKSSNPILVKFKLK